MGMIGVRMGVVMRMMGMFMIGSVIMGMRAMGGTVIVVMGMRVVMVSMRRAGLDLFRIRPLDRTAVLQHAETDAGDAAAHRPAHFEADPRKPEPLDRFDQHLGRQAGV